MSKSQRDKGARGEREFVSMLTEDLGVVVTRNLDQARDSGWDVTLGDLAIEVKRAEQAKFGPWFAKLRGLVSGTRYTHCVAWRKNGQPWRGYFEMDYEDFVKHARERL